MATSADLVAQLEAALSLTLSGTRMDSDHTLDQSIPAGETRFQIRADHDRLDDANDSNVGFEVVTLQLVVHHALLDPGNERAYTDSKKLLDQAQLLDPSYYRGLAACFDVPEGPETNETTERVGNVLAWGVALRASIQP